MPTGKRQPASSDEPDEAAQAAKAADEASDVAEQVKPFVEAYQRYATVVAEELSPASLAERFGEAYRTYATDLYQAWAPPDTSDPLGDAARNLVRAQQEARIPEEVQRRLAATQQRSLSMLGEVWAADESERTCAEALDAYLREVKEAVSRLERPTAAVLGTAGQSFVAAANVAAAVEAAVAQRKAASAAMRPSS